MRVSHRSRTAESGPPDQRRSDYRRVLLSSYLGTTIEFYDFLLYGTAAAVVFPAVFFSGLDPFTAVIFSFGTFAAGYLARPLGGVDLRALRRPARPQEDAGAHHAGHGRGVVPDRTGARRGDHRRRGPRSSWCCCGSPRASRSAASGAAPR